jgi:hypothetical protein
MMKQYAVNYKTLEKKIAALEKKFNGKVKDISEILEYLMSPPQAPGKERTLIGFRK